MNENNRKLNNETYTQELGMPIITDFTFKGESKHLIKFENCEFTWINGDDEYYPQIIIPILSQNDFPYKWEESEEMGIILRFLTMLACRFRIPFETAGHRYQFLRGEGEKHKDYLKRSAVNYSGDIKEIYGGLPESESMRLALALFREGINSSSVFYAFLNFYKIIELFSKSKRKSLKWIDGRFREAKEFNVSNIKLKKINITKCQVEEAKLDWDDVFNTLTANGWAEKISSDEVHLIASLEDTKDNMAEVLGGNFLKYLPILDSRKHITASEYLYVDIMMSPLLKMIDEKYGEYFYKLCRCAIAHASSNSKKTRNPDDYGDYYEIQKNIETMESLAFYMINSGGIKDERSLIKIPKVAHRKSIFKLFIKPLMWRSFNLYKKYFGTNDKK